VPLRLRSAPLSDNTSMHHMLGAKPTLHKGPLVAVSRGLYTCPHAAALVRVQLTPEEEKRRKEVIKIYEEAKAEAAKEEEKKVGTLRTSVLLQCFEPA